MQSADWNMLVCKALMSRGRMSSSSACRLVRAYIYSLIVLLGPQSSQRPTTARRHHTPITMPHAPPNSTAREPKRRKHLIAVIKDDKAIRTSRISRPRVFDNFMRMKRQAFRTTKCGLTSDTQRRRRHELRLSVQFVSKNDDARPPSSLIN